MRTHPVIKWTDVDGSTRQCLAEGGASDYPTLCCTDVSDPDVALKVILKNGKVTCPECKRIIHAVLKHFG